MQPTPPSLAAEAAPAPPALIVDASAGPAYLPRSRSHAVPHLFKPAARFGVRLAWTPRLELGGALLGLVDSNDHYRVLGAIAQARWALWAGTAFQVGASAGLGAGHDADILHTDLRADGEVAAYGVVAVDARWSLGRQWLLGVEASTTNLAVAQLGALVGFRFGGSR